MIELLALAIYLRRRDGSPCLVVEIRGSLRAAGTTQIAEWQSCATAAWPAPVPQRAVLLAEVLTRLLPAWCPGLDLADLAAWLEDLGADFPYRRTFRHAIGYRTDQSPEDTDFDAVAEDGEGLPYVL